MHSLLNAEHGVCELRAGLGVFVFKLEVSSIRHER